MSDEHNSNLASLLKQKDINDFPPRDRILAAALKLFVEQGYFNTNVPDLRRESKCSVGSIYHSFKNKEEVAACLYGEGIASFRKALEESIVGLKEPEDVLKTVVKSFLTFSELNHQLSKYMWLSRHGEFMNGTVQHPTFVGFDQFGRKLTVAIKRGVKDGKIRNLNANIIWSILFGIPVGYVRDWLDGYNTLSPIEVMDDISDACWRALS